MPKYRITGIVKGSKYLGEFEADNEETAREMAIDSEAAQVTLCYHCNKEIEDPQIQEFVVEVAR